MAEPIEIRNCFPALQRNVTPTASGSEVVSYTSDLGDGGPILTLIHGYPQSALIWRHLVPLLQSKVSLFIPELPGYGISTPISAGTGEHTKRAVGRVLVDALAQVFGTSSSPSPSDPESTNFFAGVNLSVAGVIMLDILPTKSQWDFFSSPPISQSYFHWPLLANVELAVPMIQAFGVANWVRGAHLRLAGSAEDSKLRIMKDDAMETHVKLFEREDVVRWTCEDYKAGAAREVQEQVEDLKQGRRVEVPTLVMFSREKLGQGGQLDVKGVWRGTAGQKDRWVGEGVELEVVGVEGGRGHYLPEEAYDVVGERVVTFLERFGL
ncbi:Alpha/Beta hydrolase protein [Pseudoneurospora amorphoporcata]|uniref:Alpha/Beta hydrolase protein n=1 Tax=Pseudoneurospora amorphoporcata TaxID=241081 RepID=A0AAN6NPU9_9PEZI|nr:Alpha/Beta hydrolase protein [Pseudoneurospora amorphoporcata]